MADGPSAGLSPLMNEAFDWFAAARSGEMSASESEKLDLWLSDDENRRAYRKVEMLWSGVEPLKSNPSVLMMREEAAPRRRPYFAWAAAAAICAMIPAAGWHFFQPVGTVAVAAAQVFSSGLGQKRTIVLSDGSVVTLDAASSVRVALSDGTRHIWLDKGRALFKVRHDPGRPFEVDAGDKKVTALGTEFLVDRSSANFDVALLDGRLRVESYRDRKPARAVEIVAGTGVQIDPRGQWAFTEVDAAASTAWLSGKLVFKEASLSEIVHQLGRYNAQRITIADQATADQRVSAVLRADDQQTFLEIVQALQLASVTRRADGSVTLSQK
jgi:transmembrane sensor